MKSFKNWTVPTVDRFRSGSVNWIGTMSNRNQTGGTGGPTEEPDEPADSIQTGRFHYYYFFLKKKTYSDLQILHRRWRSCRPQRATTPTPAVSPTVTPLQPYTPLPLLPPAAKPPPGATNPQWMKALQIVFGFWRASVIFR